VVSHVTVAWHLPMLHVGACTAPHPTPLSQTGNVHDFYVLSESQLSKLARISCALSLSAWCASGATGTALMGVARAHHIESVLVGVFCVVVSVWASHNPNQTAVIGSGASLPALLIQRSALLCVLAVHPSVCRRMWMCVCVCVYSVWYITVVSQFSRVVC